jgi:hypothetical protein
MDVPFKEQGEFFVRCLATQIVPEDAKRRRATSVSGVMVWPVHPGQLRQFPGADEGRRPPTKIRANGGGASC